MSTMRAVYTNIRAARTAIKDMARLRQIAAVLVRHGLGHVVEAWNLQDKAIVGLLVERREADSPTLTTFQRIAHALQELGPTFVKLGQILSTRPDLVPQELCEELKTLQDRVQPFPADEARRMLEESLGRPLEEVFDDFDDTPLASASIAQVHTARLKSGEEVVVKIQRPGIRHTIVSDLHILYFVARQVEQTIPEAQAFDPVSIAREFENAISKELSFGFEAANLERFDRNFSDWPSVYIPRVHKEHSSDTVLVMERLRGHKITEAGAAGHDMPPIAEECVRMLFKQVFEDGFFHGDLHPGNLWVLDDGRIGLIDFGLVGRMSQHMKDQVADLLMAMVTRNYEGVARAFYEISIRKGKVDYPAFEADSIELMERYFEHATLAEVDFGGFLRDLIEGAIRNNVRVPPDYTMFFKAIMTVEGIGKIVSPDLDLVSECRPYVEALIAQRYSPERVMRAAVDTLQSFARFGRQFPVTASQFLEQIEDGKLEIGVEEAHHEATERNKDKRTNRAALTAGGCTLLVVGAMFRDADRFTILGMPGLSLALCSLGGYVLFRLAWRIAREGRW